MYWKSNHPLGRDRATRPNFRIARNIKSALAEEMKVEIYPGTEYYKSRNAQDGTDDNNKVSHRDLD